MNELAALSFVLTLIRVLAGIVALWFLHRWLDRRTGFRFGDWLRTAAGQEGTRRYTEQGEPRHSEVLAEPMAVALYVGLRWLGSCLLLGLIVS